MKISLKARQILMMLYLLIALSAAVRADIEVVDGTDEILHLDRPAQRIISLAPHLTELLFAAGAGSQIIATVEYSDYPAEALNIPRIGSNNSISYEAIVGLSPDLVLVWQSGNGEQMIQRLKSLGLKVYVDAPATLDDIASSLGRLGQLAGTQEQAEQAVRKYRQKLSDLRRRYSERESLSVFYQVWDDPLLTLNGKHLVSEVIRLCGGRNVFADVLALVPKLSVESVIAANPQMIVASATAAQRRQWLKAWQNWSMINAVKSERLYFVPPSLLQRHSPRVLAGAEILCQQLDSARQQLPAADID
ncbi:MAG: cobalamin-binding protein [Candidatus Reddybacter sp.]